MKTYKKILSFFMIRNIHRILRGPSSPRGSVLFASRNNKYLLDLNQMMISFYSTLNLIRSLKIKGPVLFAGEHGTTFSPYYADNKKRFFFIKSWLPGLLTNWVSIFNVLKRFKKGAFAKSYEPNHPLSLGMSNNLIPDLVVAFQTPNVRCIFQECSASNIPLIYIGNQIGVGSHKVVVDLDTLIKRQVFFQLLTRFLTSLGLCIASLFLKSL